MEPYREPAGVAHATNRPAAHAGTPRAAPEAVTAIAGSLCNWQSDDQGRSQEGSEAVRKSATRRTHQRGSASAT
jgi:hypothetical protein